MKQNQPGLRSTGPRVAPTACWLLCFLSAEDPGVRAYSLLSQRPRSLDHQPLHPSGPGNPAPTVMEPCRSVALLVGSLALTSALVALSTDFWFVAIGPHYSAHSGLWPDGNPQSVAGKGEWSVLSGGIVEKSRRAQPSEVSSVSRLHPCDADLQHSGCPVWRGVCGPPGPVLHSLAVRTGPRAPCLVHHSFCCR